MTSAERVAILEGQLEESMATYDGMILRERDYVLSRGNQQGSEEELEAADAEGTPYDEADEESGEGEGEGNNGGSPPPAGPEGEEQNSGNGSNQSTSSGGGTRPAGDQHRDGDFSHQGSYAPPEDIPSGSDDDVVARQIREAAMNEADPVLREKLWQEYRKYKNQK